MTATTPSASADLARGVADLLESDRRYFELGATCEKIRAAFLVYVPGFAHVPAGCVVHRVQPNAIDNAEKWLGQIEQRMRTLGATHARLYLTEPAPTLEAALRARGYVPTEEIGILWSDPPAFSSPHIALAPVLTDADWHDKLVFHQACPPDMDGHPTAPEGWVELERRRCALGMTAFLIKQHGQPVGAVGAINMPGFLRMKNLSVHPNHRRRGIATTTARLIADMARRQGLRHMGLWALSGYPGEAVYRKMGLNVVVRQVDWTQPRWSTS